MREIRSDNQCAKRLGRPSTGLDSLRSFTPNAENLARPIRRGAMQLSVIDWSKVLTFVVGISTVFFGVTTFFMQRRQAEIQRQQAVTSDRTFRLSLFEKRMAVFNAFTKFLAGISQTANVTLPQTFAMLSETRDHEFLFGPEVQDFINEAYQRGVALGFSRTLPLPQRNTPQEPPSCAGIAGS